MDTLETVGWDRYDFLDLGASAGGSLRACAEKFGVRRGLGVDIDPRKVHRGRAAGLDVVCADAQDLGLCNVVRFVSALDFLEHLPGLDAVERVLAAAARAATDFIFIGHPSFEGEHYLRAMGVTQYWHNWSGHTAHITISDYCSMFNRLGLHRYSIHYVTRVATADHESILPLGLPKNQGPYDRTAHGVRPSLTFHDPIWRAQRIFVALRPFGTEEWDSVVNAWTS